MASKVKEEYYYNVKLFGLSPDPMAAAETSGLWGIVDGNLEFVTRAMQAFKNDHPKYKVWMDLNGKKVTCDKITAKPALFEKVVRKPIQEKSTEDYAIELLVKRQALKNAEPLIEVVKFVRKAII